MEPSCVNILVTVFALIIVNSSATVFLKEPEDNNVTVAYASDVNGAVELECQVSSIEPDQKISWYKNGMIISDSFVLRADSDLVDPLRYLLIRYESGIGVKLFVLLINIQTAEVDKGHYQCAVTSQDDVIIDNGASRIAEVQIFARPRPEFLDCKVTDSSGELGMTNPVTSVTAGEHYTLTCMSDSGLPTVSLSWSRGFSGDVQPLVSRPGYSEESNMFFIDYNWTVTPTASDIKTLDFTCTLQHPLLSSYVECNVGPFEVRHAPILAIEPHHVDVTSETLDVVFNCVINANPPVEQIDWFVNGTNIANNNIFETNGTTLKFLNVSILNYGEYVIMCTAINYLGSESANATLNNNPTSGPGKQIDSGNTGLIVGIVIGCIVFITVVAVLILVVVYICKRRKMLDDDVKENGMPSEPFEDNDRSRNDNAKAISAYTSSNVDVKNEYENTVNMASVELELKQQQNDFNGGENEANARDNSREEPVYAKPFKKAKAVRGTVEADIPGDFDGHTKEGVSLGNEKPKYENITTSTTEERAYDIVSEEADRSNQDEKTREALRKNVEGITYAELDLSSSNVNTNQPVRKDDPVMYSELKY